jgi:hypothetical protein
MSTTGGAPAAPRTTSTSSWVVGVSQRRITSGSSTVAERPTRRRDGANCCRRESPSESRSPRFDGQVACTSSTMTHLKSSKYRRAPSQAQNSASCSGVVSSMSGGFTRWRWRRASPVSPVRLSALIANPISAIGAIRLRSTSTASAFSGER